MSNNASRARSANPNIRQHPVNINVKSGNNADKSRPRTTNKPENKVVGQYRLGKTIGEGTFGKVKIAQHIPTGEKVCNMYCT